MARLPPRALGSTLSSAASMAAPPVKKGGDDPRMGDIIQCGGHGDLGFPYDEGVRRNGGRPGAGAGPAVVRRLMQRVGTAVNPEYNMSLEHVKIVDGGDIPCGHVLEQGHALLRERVSAILHDGGIPFVVGGGNDQSYPNGAALLDNAKGKVGIVNIDAHLDVRPLKEGKTHSGSPFRQLLCDSRFHGANFREFAAQGNQCSAEHADYVVKQGGKIIWLKDLQGKNVGAEFQKLLDELGDELFVSFDIDSIISSECPGVSAPGTRGITGQDALDICLVAGKHPKVRLFDLSEYNPAIEDYRTGRLVANMFYYFCLGVAMRTTSQK